jgi:xylan 1,4-beta-xylosidase
MKIDNPILTGFNPDPSICVVKDDFYIATSTFEWFPGVQIHHSNDLKNWRLLTRPLNRVSQLDLKGCQHSGGVWAPCLTYSDDMFWLVYTNVRSHGGPVTDSPYFLVTASNIEGPWSEPIKLGANGFDPSLFHDQSGKKYLVNMQMGDLDANKRFEGITIREYDHNEKRFVGDSIHIWDGTELGLTEGPHLYQKDGWYYLIAAEGGTGLSHAVSIARSKDIYGPYETDPNNPMLTSKNRPDLYLKTAGHGDLFQIQDGSWYMVHLCQRPIQKCGIPEVDWTKDKISILGRETALQQIVWPEGEFPRLKECGNGPFDSVEAPKLPECPWTESLNDNFDEDKLNIHFQSLREPIDESWCSLKRKSGTLCLLGRNSLFSRFDQSLVARRLQHFKAEAETSMLFKPKSPKQEAGLIAYYDRMNYHYLRASLAENGMIDISVASSNNSTGWGENSFIITKGGTCLNSSKIGMKMVNNFSDLKFAWRIDDGEWNWFEKTFDSTNMGDGCSKISNFTGTFWGICCQDMTGDGTWAEFDYFNYRPIVD